MGIEVFGGKEEQKSNETLFGFQIQGTIRAKDKEAAESFLYNVLVNKVEGLAQLLIR